VHHRFIAKESDCGFTRFYDLSKLFVLLENRTCPLIENDACNITAFVRIINDPTGFLWHNFTKYFYLILNYIMVLKLFFHVNFSHSKEIKANEHHLYLLIKIVTPYTFARHQGFDLTNFNNLQ
ncbi:1844_t:CDS:2, partial [Gigaspora margarita]